MFAPVASFALLPHLMVVPEQVPAKTVAEFVAYAKANPGKVNFGAGLGTPPHLLGDAVQDKAGIDVTYVPYQGAAQSVIDLVAGRNHYTIDGTVILMPQVRAGKLRAIGIGRAERWPELPEVPTLVESGYPDFTLDAWTGVVAPHGTPSRSSPRSTPPSTRASRPPRPRPRSTASARCRPPGHQRSSAPSSPSRAAWGELVKLAGARVE